MQRCGWTVIVAIVLLITMRLPALFSLNLCFCCYQTYIVAATDEASDDLDGPWYLLFDDASSELMSGHRKMKLMVSTESDVTSVIAAGY